jgi:hypothetical protein
MDIIGVSDYFAVGSVAGAYTRVAPFVNSFPEYRLALAEHLLSTKLAHWEKSLRELSAKGLASLVPHSAEFLATEGVGLLLPRGTDAVLEVRHGALVGLSALLPALQAAGHWPLSAEHAAGVAALIPAIDKARLYRGKGGEVMRQGVSALIAAMGETSLPLTKPQHAKVLEALDENLRSPQLYIQQAAVAALGHYCRAYCSSGGGDGGTERYDAFVSRTLPGLTGRLHDANVAVRRGHALALGALPLAIVGPAGAATCRSSWIADIYILGLPHTRTLGRKHALAHTMTVQTRACSAKCSAVQCKHALAHTVPVTGEAVLSALLGGMVPEDNADDRDVEARVNCTVALRQVCATLMDGEALAAGDDAALKMPRAAALSALHRRVLPSLQSALQDYTTDNRGDVGSLVRAAAMQAMEDCVLLAARLTGDAGTGASDTDDARLASSVSCAAAALLKQAVERITRVRDAALRHLSALVASPPCARHLPACRALSLALPSSDEAASVSASAPASGAANVSSGIRIWSVGRPSGLDSVGTLAQLLPVPHYTTALLEGLVASIGGVDAALAKAAGAALASLVDACSSAPTESEEEGAVAAAVAAAGDRASAARALRSRSVLPRIACALLDVWARHAKSPRLAGPLLRTACLLASRTDLLAVLVVPPPPSTTTATDNNTGGSGDTSSVTSPVPVPLPQLLVSLARAETRGCGDVARLTDAGSLLCALVPHANPCHASAVQGLLVLLISRYPLVSGGRGRAAGACRVHGRSYRCPHCHARLRLLCV